MFKLLFECFIG